MREDRNETKRNMLFITEMIARQKNALSRYYNLRVLIRCKVENGATMRGIESPSSAGGGQGR